MKKLLAISLYFTSTLMYSQNIKVTGVVSDSLGIGLELANIMAVNVSDDKMDGYSISGTNGQFSLNLKANTNYQIKVSYLGYSPKIINLKTETTNIQLPITLKTESTLLDEIEIVHQMPVSIKGDTIVYNADSFTSGTERKLGDILKKLPGVEVDSDGNITVDGKPVQKLMVEDRDFFDGNTKLGVQNIPADAVDKVEVLKNYNEINQLKSVTNNQDNLAMNIKLKENKKNFWFGDVNAGIGVAHEDARYIANPKLFYYSPKYSLNFLSNFNNIGEQALTITDYFKMTGGLKNLLAKGGSSLNLSSNDLDFSMIPNNKVKEMDTKFGAFNFSYNPTQKWTITSFGILSGNDTTMDFWNKNAILNSETSETVTIEESNNKTSLSSELFLLKLGSNYKPNDKLTFDYDLFMKKSNLSENFQSNSRVTPNTNQDQDINTSKKQSPFSFNQDIGLYYELNPKHIFTLNAQHLYKNEDPFYNANLQLKPFDFLGFNNDQVRQNINQERFINTNKLDIKADYFHSLTRKMILNITLGKTHSYQRFNSTIFQILDDNSKNNLTAATLNNDVTYKYNNAFIGLHYKIKLGKVTLNPGVTLHKYNLTDEQLGETNKTAFSKFLPDFEADYSISRSKRLNYRFAVTNNFTDIVQLAEGYQLQGYNNLFRGNRNLENATHITHNLSYTIFSAYNQEHFSAHVAHSKMLDNINSVAQYDGINRVTNLYNSNFADESFTTYLRFGKTFASYYKFNVGGSVNLLRKNIIQINPATNVGNEITRESLNQDYSVSFRTNYQDLPNLEIGYGISVNKYPEETFYNSSPKAALDYYFLNGFSLTADYTFNKYYNKSKYVNDTYDFFNASLAYYKKDSKWEYRLSATNILNTKTLNSDHFSQFNITTSRYYIQPRYVVVSLKYNL